ncbi:MAG: hypothetical protein AAGA18_05245 [Verrucomicrobiota bacterium]
MKKVNLKDSNSRSLCATKLMLYFNTALILAFTSYFLIIPGFDIVRDLTDPNIRNEGIPQRAWRLHEALTPRYAKWAKQRVASAKAGSLYLYDVPATEWPMFGSVFYLWATEALQLAWEKDPSLTKRAPKEYASDAIEASKDLIMDPVHHTWVRQHWGDDYLHNENAFFRSLLIAGLTSYEKLTGSGKYLAFIRDQVNTLAQELDASPLGLLEDYPGECYPIDIVMVIACIKRADDLIGTDHSAFVKRAIRAFEGDMLDQRGLIPFFVNYKTGVQGQPSRGIGMSHTLIFAHEIWPEQAKEWYRKYEEYFWQERIGASGYREFPKDLSGYDWTYDVDAGPIIAGFSPSGNAFGIALARINGRLDHGYILLSQVLTAPWPLPNGELLGARVLSDPIHAPYWGEAGILFFLTQTPADGMEVIKGGSLPLLVYLGLSFYFGLGGVVIFSLWSKLRYWRKKNTATFWVIGQGTLWLILLVSGIILCLMGQRWTGIILLILSSAFPVTLRPWKWPFPQSKKVSGSQKEESHAC